MDTRALKGLFDLFSLNWNDGIVIRDHETFVWKAVTHFQENWNENDPDFSSMFCEAFDQKRTSIFIDTNGRYPLTVIRNATKDNARANKIKECFISLYKDTVTIDDKEVLLRNFIDDVNTISKPKRTIEKTDMFAAVRFLCMKHPWSNYFYKARDAISFAQYVRSDKYIGIGTNFSLEAYYSICEEVRNLMIHHNGMQQVLSETISYFSSVQSMTEDQKTRANEHIMVYCLIYSGSCHLKLY